MTQRTDLVLATHCPCSPENRNERGPTLDSGLNLSRLDSGLNLSRRPLTGGPHRHAHWNVLKLYRYTEHIVTSEEGSNENAKNQVSLQLNCFRLAKSTHFVTYHNKNQQDAFCGDKRASERLNLALAEMRGCAYN